jgi:hypothetical protein
MTVVGVIASVLQAGWFVIVAVLNGNPWWSVSALGSVAIAAAIRWGGRRISHARDVAELDGVNVP